MKYLAVSITIQTESGYRSREAFNSRDQFEEPKVVLLNAIESLVQTALAAGLSTEVKAILTNEGK